METASHKCEWQLRLPDGTRIGGSSDSICNGLQIPGFVISPFDTGEHLILSIPTDNAATDFSPLVNIERHNTLPEAATSREQHLQNVATTARYHRENDTRGKTVISRVSIHQTELGTEQLFRNLDRLYPDAYIFCFNTPATGTWIGASPELLLEAHNGTLHTMSLAGTRQAGTTEEWGWDDKNIVEQQIVTDTICDTFRQHGLTPVTTKPQTLRAGSVEHRCTHITADLPPHWNSNCLQQLLADLSPTPALGGYPKDASISLIRRLEKHDRSCYGGYFGYIESPTEFRFNVCLRCAQLADGKAYIYTGGGITSLSDPEAEWEETCRKEQTMLAALGITSKQG